MKNKPMQFLLILLAVSILNGCRQTTGGENHVDGIVSINERIAIIQDQIISNEEAISTNQDRISRLELFIFGNSVEFEVPKGFFGVEEWIRYEDFDWEVLAPGSSEAYDYQQNYAANHNLLVEVINDYGMRFRLIPPGNYFMGSPAGEGISEGQIEKEQPVVEVTISRPFYAQVGELTNGEWEKVMGERYSYSEGDSDHPVVGIKWIEISEFLNRLNERVEGSTGYRLPSEAEWEYLCRAGTKTAFYGGAISNTDGFDPVLSRLGWYQQNARGQVMPNSLIKQPNAWGMINTHGNVGEWVQDDYFPNHFGAPLTEAPRIQSPRKETRVVKGGDSGSWPFQCRSSSRKEQASVAIHKATGFRLVRGINEIATP